MQKNLRNNEGQTGEKKREGEYCDEKEGGEGGGECRKCEVVKGGMLCY